MAGTKSKIWHRVMGPRNRENDIKEISEYLKKLWDEEEIEDGPKAYHEMAAYIDFIHLVPTSGKPFQIKTFNKLLSLSKKSYPHFIALCKISASYIKNSEQPPVQIRRWVVSYLLGEIKAPKRKKLKNIPKEFRLNMAAWIVVQKGYSLRKNPASQHSNSACDIVSAAATKAGVKRISSEVVYAAYKRYRNMWVK